LISSAEALEETRSDYENETYGEENVGCIGIDMPDMHAPNDAREPAQRRHRRFDNQSIDDMDFGMVPPDGGAKVASNHFDIILPSGRT
jgi:hypothetical protein